MRKLALWALAALILADLVPALILDAERNIKNLSSQAGQAYAAWRCPKGTLRDDGCWVFDGNYWANSDTGEVEGWSRVPANLHILKQAP
jgi:hypothetical protein